MTTKEWIDPPTDDYAAGKDISGESYGLISDTDQLGRNEDGLEDAEAYPLIGDTIGVVDENRTTVSVVRRATIPGRSNS